MQIIEDHEEGFTFNPHQMMWAIGSGEIARDLGAEAEQVAAAVFIAGTKGASEERGETGVDWDSVSVDEFIEMARELVKAGAVTATGVQMETAVEVVGKMTT